MTARRRSLLDALKGLLDGPPAPPGCDDPLASVVREHMPDADEDTRRVVTAVAGLLASVAYADTDYSEAERRQVRVELGRLRALDASGVDALCHVLESDIGGITAAGDQTWVRDLRALTDTRQRVEVLEVLMALAAADDDFSMAETNHLRRLATALGLSQRDYTAVQSRHRAKLSVLRRG